MDYVFPFSWDCHFIPTDELTPSFFRGVGSNQVPALIADPVLFMIFISTILHSGWWFGTFLFFHILGMSFYPNWRTHSIIFQRGRAQPPTRILLTITNHIITITIYYPLLTVYPTSKCLLTVCGYHQSQGNQCNQSSPGRAPKIPLSWPWHT